VRIRLGSLAYQNMRDDVVRKEGNAVLCTSIEEERNVWLQCLLGFGGTG
jgi:hypothetical protein